MFPLLFLTAAFLAGIVCAAALGAPLPMEWLAAGAVVPAAALILWWGEARGRWLCLCGVLFLLGAWRYQTAQGGAGEMLSRYHDGAPVSLEGIVTTPPDVRDQSTNLRVEVTRLKTPEGWQEASGSVLALLPRYEAIAYGDQIELRGVLHAPPVFEDFSYEAYLAKQGIYSLMYRPRITRLATGQGNPFYAALFALREHAQATVEQSLPEPQASLLSGILLGQARGIPAETLDAFNRTGTSHIIAISGYNVTIIAGFLAGIAVLFVRKRQTWLFVTLGIAAYVLLVGASASVVRAGVMGGLYVLASVFGRRSTTLAALALAALVMALQSPLVLWDIGFQLSFVATLGLIELATPLASAFKRLLAQRGLGKQASGLLLAAGESVWVTLAATLATLPLIVYHFHRLSLLSLPVNMLVLPAQPPLMLSGLLLVVAGFISPALAQVAGWLAYPFLAWTTGVVEAAARIPFASVETGEVPGVVVGAYYLVLVALVAYFMQPRLQRVNMWQALPRLRPLAPVAPLALVTSLFWAGAVAQPDGALHVSFLDVGQGDATLIKTPSGQVVLIDGGPSPTRLADALGRALPFYRRDIALLVLSRASDEKLTGLVSALEHYDVAQVIEPALTRNSTALARWRELLAEKHISAQRALGGKRVDLGDGVQLEVESAGNEDEGLALRLRYGAHSIYFDSDGERRVMPAQDALVVRVARHGDAKSVSAEWLAALAPQFALISSGADKKQAPAAEALASLGEAGVLVYRTDEHGTVTFRSDGERWWVEVRR
jgi:competence protein ComEC